MKSTRLRDNIVFVLVWVPYALLSYRFWWLCDDAFISFRYARNWADGLGLRFNPGSDPPVEGYSNFLWTAFCALIELLGLDVTFWPPLVSFACGSLLLYLLFRVLRERLSVALLPACLATLLLGCAPPYFVWSSSGLETVPFALLTFVTVERLVLRRDGPAPISGGLAGLGLALIRTEGIAWTVLIGLLAAIRQLPAWWRSRRPTAPAPRPHPQGRKEKRAAARGHKQKGHKHRPAQTTKPHEPTAVTGPVGGHPLRPVLLYFAIVGIGFGIYFACRYAYFGEPLSNTAYAKMGVSAATLNRGLRYVGAYFLTLITPVLFVPGCVTALGSRVRAVGLPVAFMSLASLGYTVATGADFMAMWRFLVPGFVVFNALLVGCFLHACWGRAMWRRAFTTVLGVVAIGVGLLPAWDVHVAPESIRKDTHFRGGWKFRSEYTFWKHMSNNSEVWSAYGLALGEHTEPGDSCVLVFIGAIGYHSDLYIYDQAGLVTPEVARREVTSDKTTPGHDKQVSWSYFLKDEPTILYVVEKPQPARGVASLAQQLRRAQTKDQYVADFMPVELDDGDPTRRYLVVLRRIEDGTEPAAAWANLSARVRTLLRESTPAAG